MYSFFIYILLNNMTENL